MVYETVLKTTLVGIEHGIAGRLRRAGGHENLAVFVGVESLNGGVERTDLKGKFLETRTRSAGKLENCSEEGVNIAGLAKGKPEKRETQEAHILSKNRDRESQPQPQPQPQTIQLTHPIKREVSESFKFTDSDPDTGSEDDELDDELEVEKFKFVILKAMKDFELDNWEKSEEYFKAAIKIWGAVRDHPGMKGFGLPSLEAHLEKVDEKSMTVYLAWSQLLQGKPNETLQTVNLLSDEAIRASTGIHGVVEWTIASAYYRLGDLKRARRHCRKAVKLAREAKSLDLSHVSIELMVEVLEKIDSSESIELEFYKSLLPPDSEGASEGH
ncbi:hypothetical protein TWF106_003644 [Orbilia oligospora]|uniref:Uncharacterized protein n=1 Tax=Orbilia oligospora TaxID=2813651 RepID=A0A7C8UWS2_ORBOL|nr:hypothetical protein TWF106_003644 [Orbilia oligospora]